MTKPKRKPRGVVARFLEGDSLAKIAASSYHLPDPTFLAIEAILRRALKKKTGKR